MREKGQGASSLKFGIPLFSEERKGMFERKKKPGVPLVG
jgi:hypothetical protein